MFPPYLNPGGRGLKMDTWNATKPRYLTDIWSYNENTTGYWSQWVDTMPYDFPYEMDRFCTRTRGFFVPPNSGNYRIYLQCDDRCELYLSNSTLPEDKVLTESLLQNNPYFKYWMLQNQKKQSVLCCMYYFVNPIFPACNIVFHNLHFRLKLLTRRLIHQASPEIHKSLK